MFKRPPRKQYIEHGRVFCPRREHDVDSDTCVSCTRRVDFRPDAKPPYVLCEGEHRISLWPSGLHSGW